MASVFHVSDATQVHHLSDTSQVYQVNVSETATVQQVSGVFQVSEGASSTFPLSPSVTNTGMSNVQQQFGLEVLKKGKDNNFLARYLLI